MSVMTKPEFNFFNLCQKLCLTKTEVYCIASPLLKEETIVKIISQRLTQANILHTKKKCGNFVQHQDFNKRVLKLKETAHLIFIICLFNKYEAYSYYNEVGH